VINDRGNIKWTAMMLPEHVELLREWQKEDKYQVSPELDEQRLEEMNEIIQEAMAFHEYLSFTYHENRDVHQITGHVHYVDEVKGELRIMDQQETIHRVKLNKITDVRVV
jgi:hypothetical protein